MTAASETRTTKREAEPQTIDVAALLNGHTRVILEYAGKQYQLKVTRLGKLILTK